MEYSLQIDLVICLNTEYVWTRRTKKSEVDIYLLRLFLSSYTEFFCDKH